MADRKVRITELPLTEEISGLQTIGVNADNESVRFPIGNMIEEHLETLSNAEQAATKANTAAAAADTAASEANTAAAAANAAADKANSAESITIAEEAATKANTAAEAAQAVVDQFESLIEVIVPSFDGFIDASDNRTIQDSTSTEVSNVWFHKGYNLFVGELEDASLWKDWTTQYGRTGTAALYNNDEGTALLKGKIYSYNGTFYMWSNTENTLISIGS